jgi:hypothetical protein
MPVYHFHLRGDGLDFPDECGGWYEGPDHARARALWFAREVLAEAIEEGMMPLKAFVDVADARGASLFALPLRSVAEAAAPGLLRRRAAGAA